MVFIRTSARSHGLGVVHHRQERRVVAGEGVIRSHALADVRLPTVPKKTTGRDMARGGALRHHGTGPRSIRDRQAKWNSKVGNVAVAAPVVTRIRRANRTE